MRVNSLELCVGLNDSCGIDDAEVGNDSARRAVVTKDDVYPLVLRARLRLLGYELRNALPAAGILNCTAELRYCLSRKP